jgi:hypothetical protein
MSRYSSVVTPAHGLLGSRQRSAAVARWSTQGRACAAAAVRAAVFSSQVSEVHGTAGSRRPPRSPEAQADRHGKAELETVHRASVKTHQLKRPDRTMLIATVYVRSSTRTVRVTRFRRHKVFRVALSAPLDAPPPFFVQEHFDLSISLCRRTCQLQVSTSVERDDYYSSV